MRPRRPPYLPGHYYHIYNRGAHGVSIFREKDNYLFVLRKVKKYLREFSLTIIAYCLMLNHYHFLVRQDDKHKAGLLPQRVFNSYSKAYNKRYGHSGTLFEAHTRSFTWTNRITCCIFAAISTPTRSRMVSLPGWKIGPTRITQNGLEPAPARW
ncbi:MAG: transposase [Anaerolineales bacterium]